ncbi:MAG: FapA family protein, partial [Alicyclobacillus sp.]|nr:FapA family protein [Alicyclobacillus sp.]
DPVHRRMRISTVPLGTTVAILEPEIPGVPGRDVFGREVPCPKHRPLPVLGQGVVDVNGRIVATREGRFLLTKSRIDVVPELLIPHDLSSKDGKIEFDGNVVVLGSVLDGSFINASGSVEVHGSVLCSTVMGEHGVYIANAIVGSEVMAGQSKFLYAKLYSVVKDCLKDFLQFRTEYKEVVDYVTKHRQGDVRIPSIANMLLSKRHSNLERSLMELGSDNHRLANTDERYKQIVLELRSKWSGIGRTNIYERDIDLLHRYLKDYAGYVESLMSADLANVKSASVTSSSVRASGKIVITGAGVYASSFEAGDSIVVRRTVRGGFLVAKNSVHVDELGTPSGTETSVKVLSPSGKVRIRMRHPNTLIQVGERRDRNIEAEVNAMWRGKGHANPNASRRRLA